MHLALAVLFCLAAPSPRLPACVQQNDVDRIAARAAQRLGASGVSEPERRRIWSDTRTELEQFLKDHPGHPDVPRAAFQIAETYVGAGDLDHAAERFQDFLRKYPGEADAAAARFHLAEIQLEKEQDGAARASFLEFAQLYPKDDRALFARLYVAVTLQNEQRYEEAAAQLRSVREDYKGRKESWSAQMQLAIVAHVQEKNAEARRILEEIIRECPEPGPVEIARRHLAEYLKLGREAPPFSEKDTEGQDVSPESLRGKVVVLYFFDPRAEGALTEAGFLRRSREEAAAAGKADELRILGVSISTERRDIPLYRVTTREDWPLFFDEQGIEGTLARRYDVRGLPTLWVLDRAGRYRFFNVAGRDYRHAVEKLLQEK